MLSPKMTQTSKARMLAPTAAIMAFPAMAVRPLLPRADVELAVHAGPEPLSTEYTARGGIDVSHILEQAMLNGP